MKRHLLIMCAVLLFFSGQAFGQERVISGKVTSEEDNSAAPGVNISLKGTSIGTSTDAEGNYRITVPGNNAVLVFSFVSFKTVEVTVGNRSVIDLQMEPSQTELSEVVVTGYGSQLKQDLTGNIATVKGADIQNTPVTNFTQALQGRASGVFIESENGKVGGGIKVRVRGATSINGSNEPLYVVDGIPINTNSIGGNVLADLNFNDVESFEVLKDASAAAIYGARGANGVVLITTKRGKSGKTKFSVNLQYGANKPTNDNRAFLNAEEYINYFTEAAENGARYYWNRQNDLALDEGYGSEQEVVDDWLSVMEGRFDRYSGHSDWRTLETNTNWQKQAFQSAKNVSADITVSGGNDKTKFFISTGITDQDGILIGNTFKRISSRINLDHQVNDRFSVGVNLNISKTLSGRVAADNEFLTPMQLVALAPITPVRDEDGNLYDRPTTTYYNSLIEYENSVYNLSSFRNLGGMYGSLKIIDGLILRSEFAYDITTQNVDEYYNSKTYVGSGTNGYGSSDWYRDVNYNTNNYLNYTKTIGVNFFDVTLGMAYQKSNNDRTWVTAEQFPLDALQKIASAGSITGGFSSASEFSFLSYFGRINYKLNDRYLVGLTGRVDGSSRFGTNNRYGFFPSASVGWVLSEENFVKDVSAISFLKLRASYGLAGNGEIGNFGQLGLWGTSRYYGSSALVPSQLPNPELGWEKTAQFDIGLDFGILSNRINGEIDFYIKNTTDLLYDVPVPGTSGYTTLLDNVGEMQNTGFEIVINSVNIDANSFKWETSFNFARNKNEIRRLDGEQKIIPGNDGRYLNSLVVGESIGVFYGPKYAGVDPANGDALYYLPDGEGTTNDYNLAGDFVVGDPNPDFIYGLTNTFSYKGLELSVLLQGVYGNEIMNGAGGFMSANGDWFDNQTRDQLNSWKEPGDITNVPEARWNWSGTIPNGLGASSRYIYDGSYLRVKNVTLAYTLPSEITGKIKLSSLRVYVTGTNLFTFTDYPGWDPEVNTDYRASNRNQGNDFYAAPQIKTYVVGLNIGF